MGSAYRNNHYVPQWYQKRFLPANARDQELVYLDIKPRFLVTATGQCSPQRSVKRTGFKHCFAQEDLYTLAFGGEVSTDAEQRFFGEVDNLGRHAVEYFTSFEHPSMDDGAFQALLRYLTVQKLRTPKGLAWLRTQTRLRDKARLLSYLEAVEYIYSAVWSECIWQIADAKNSTTKFIVSDHPVTVYNRACPPTSIWARGINDPDIRFHGTHTIFPLSLEKVLILTNLSWVRNPYQHPRGVRPNPQLCRNTFFDYRTIQVLRSLTEPEVVEINYIIKSRALRYVAAGRPEWLHPERQISSVWNNFGGGLLLMPDPRSIRFSGSLIVGHWDGSSSAWDEYGRRPSERAFADRERSLSEWQTFHRFIGEFARLKGPERRGRAFDFLHLDPERDPEDRHAANLRYETEYSRFRFL